MKKVLFVVAIITMFVACAPKTTDTTNTTTDSIVTELVTDSVVVADSVAVDTIVAE